jgi:hypothetical protein
MQICRCQKGMMSIAKTILALCVVHTAFAGPVTFQLSEVTAREWKIGEKQVMRLTKLEQTDCPKITLAVAHYGLKPEETTVLDFYEYRAVTGSTNANLVLLGHDIEEGRLVSVSATPRTNETLAIISVVREKKNLAGKLVHNMYGYRVTAEGLIRTTDNLVWEAKDTPPSAKKWFSLFK